MPFCTNFWETYPIFYLLLSVCQMGIVSSVAHVTNNEGQTFHGLVRMKQHTPSKMSSRSSAVVYGSSSFVNDMAVSDSNCKASENVKLKDKRTRTRHLIWTHETRITDVWWIIYVCLISWFDVDGHQAFLESFGFAAAKVVPENGKSIDALVSELQGLNWGFRTDNTVTDGSQGRQQSPSANPQVRNGFIRFWYPLCKPFMAHPCSL